MYKFDIVLAFGKLTIVSKFSKWQKLMNDDDAIQCNFPKHKFPKHKFYNDTVLRVC